MRRHGGAVLVPYRFFLAEARELLGVPILSCNDVIVSPSSVSTDEATLGRRTPLVDPEGDLVAALRGVTVSAPDAAAAAASSRAEPGSLSEPALESICHADGW